MSKTVKNLKVSDMVITAQYFTSQGDWDKLITITFTPNGYSKDRQTFEGEYVIEYGDIKLECVMGSYMLGQTLKHELYESWRIYKEVCLIMNKWDKDCELIDDRLKYVFNNRF